jgi:RNA polymerase-binding transcription factor DksA
VEPDDARRRLEEEQGRLGRIRDSIERDHLHDEPEEDSSAELSHFDQHPADAASDAFEREKDFAILGRVQSELEDVERALQRLDEGTYGTCEVCSRPIDDERLQAMPAARFCLEHQTHVET